jgi:hypothetical protein
MTVHAALEQRPIAHQRQQPRLKEAQPQLNASRVPRRHARQQPLQQRKHAWLWVSIGQQRIHQIDGIQRGPELFPIVTNILKGRQNVGVVDAIETPGLFAKEHEPNQRQGLEATPEAAAQLSGPFGHPSDLAVFKGETGDETVGLAQRAIA